MRGVQFYFGADAGAVPGSGVAAAVKNDAETRLANVAAIWRQARPWIRFPQPRRLSRDFRDSIGNPAWTNLKRYGWLHGFNASRQDSYGHLERGMWISMIYRFDGRGWVNEYE